MNDEDERKLLILGVAVLISLTVFAGSVGYIAVFSPLFGSIQLSPGNIYNEMCMNGMLIECEYNNPILDELLCSC